MRKEFNIFIVLALLVNSPGVIAQDKDLDDKDLQALLDEKPVSDTPAEAPSTSPEPETLTSDTVDLESLEKADAEAVVEEPATPAPTTTENIDTLEALEPLESTPTIPSTISDSPSESTSTADDLEALKSDMDSEELKPIEDAPVLVEKVEPKKTEEKKEEAATAKKAKASQTDVFDVGREERDLLSIAQNIQGQISDNEWNEVATAAKVDSYTVVKDDWLFKISKRIFGSGFYYPKIWSLNSFIVNPHYIEPGMVLSFTTGSGNQAPEFKLGIFTEDEINADPGSTGNSNSSDLANFGDNAIPSWLTEKNSLSNQGVYFQYASEETMEDLAKASEQSLNREYENYDPPKSDFGIVIPKNYDSTGFDKGSRIFYSFKEGYYLSTFVSTNIVQDFGSIVNGPDENIFFTKLDKAYVKFDETINVLPGDKFSVYSADGKVKHPKSDREGYKYTIVGQIKILRKMEDKWEVEFFETSGTPQRGDRITAYTPKIDRITHTYNSRLIEAGIIASFQPKQLMVGFGDVVFLDRGRADGVEMGNVFDVYGFKDRLTNKNITDQPTYKMGEITVITLTDNFATGLVTKSRRDFYTGDIALTKTKEEHLREQSAKNAKVSGEKDMIGGKALEELDVDLNLDNMNDDLLKQADKIELTEDELAELERQEREKSVIKDSERDLKSLERLENEIENAETILNDAKLDEDKLLEGEDLNNIEKKNGSADQDSLDEIEENLGKRYVDEDLNSKDNPYGLTEFDVEEVDELLNVEKTPQK